MIMSRPNINLVDAVRINTLKEDQAVALLGVRIESRIQGLIERSVLTQSFRNDEDEPIEVMYTFPLPEDATVCGFEVITAERVLTGKVKKRDEAVEDYDTAITEGHGAYMLESHRRNVFTVNVGNINPGQLAVLRIDWIRLLTVTDDKLSLNFPTTVPPRYITNTGSSNTAAAFNEGEMINPLQGVTVPYGLQLDLTVDNSLPIDGVTSASHQLVVLPDVNENKSAISRVSLAEGQVDMDRDVTLEVTLKKSLEPLSVVETVNGKHYAAVSFLPDFEALGFVAAELSNVVFVVDCSGSMDGHSISQAKRALALCLRALKAGDTFNIVRFGSSFESYSETMAVYGEESLQMALDWVKATDATLGGTELMGPLQHILGSHDPLSEDMVDIVLLTDGQISNERAVIELAGSHSSTHRVFSFGIGAAAGRSLCNGLASSTNGAAEFIANDERVEEKVLRTFCRMASPRFTNMKLKTGTGTRVVLPTAKLPVIFDGDAICLLAQIEGDIPQDGLFWSLHAESDGKVIEWPISIGTPVPLDSVSTGAVGVAWANERIRQLESQVSDYSEVYSSPNGRSDRNEHRKLKQIVALSEEFNILCDHTAFIALEHRSLEQRNNGTPAQREVPALVPHRHGLADELGEVLSNDVQLFESRMCYFSKSFVSMGLFAEIAPDELFELLALQQSDGSFKVASTNSTAFKAFQEKLHISAIDFSQFDKLIELNITQTLYVLFTLDDTHADRKDLWSRAAKKAYDFLHGLGLDKSVVIAASTSRVD